ncbi:MAG: T9SS type A sorting domain-containing protein [Sphingobacteriales bacterium]|nr:MAG: T9SS type A sorting domain-containing protein [Sphingobacteriales bacterium]
MQLIFHKNKNKFLRHFVLLFLLFAYTVLPKNALGQQFKLFQSSGGAQIVINQKDTLLNAWAGGMLNPQFSNIDFNNDGRQDIFVFEPADSKISLFQSLTNGEYLYVPQFESSFPNLKNWALLVDYNKDGKADIFTFAQRSAGIDIYKNISSGNKLAFEKVADQLEYEDIEFRLNLYAPSSDIPAITDIDNDGDLDILSYDVLQYHIQYYKNLSMEKYGVPDSLDYRIADRCWGKFAESFSANTVILGEDCGKVGKRGKQHGGSTLLAFDNDGDGDKDMLLGDIGYKNLLFLENGRIRNNAPFTEMDSMIMVDTTFPKNTMQKADITLFPAAFLVDINGDNISDLVVSPQALFESQTRNQVLAYINNGPQNKPKFDFLRSTFLQNTMFYGEERSAPAFVDYNNDSLMDLVIGVKANEQNHYEYSKLQLYKNIGTRTKAVFTLVKNDLGSLSTAGMAALTPAFKDLNGDEKPDLVVGNENGDVLFYYNQGLDAAQIPTFSKQNLPEISVGQNSKPALADLDGDGLIDLLVGELSGNINYYKNTGSANSPVFTLVTDTFGGIVTNHFYYQYEYDDDGNIIDSTRVKESNGASAPALTDMDGDGKTDLVLGTTYGELFICFNVTDSLNKKLTPVSNLIYNQFTGKTEAKIFGYVTVPAASDLDGDGKAEILLGNYRGGLYYFASQPVVLAINETINNSKAGKLSVYPNPASKNLYIQWPENASSKDYNLLITNALGQVTYMQSVKNALGKPLVTDVSNLAAGLYIVTLTDADGKYFSAKIYMAP